MVPECFDRYDFDYIGLESFDFCGPQSRAKISHARWTSFSHINWYKKCRAFHKAANGGTLLGSFHSDIKLYGIAAWQPE
jgi:hypothetical protein